MCTRAGTDCVANQQDVWREQSSSFNLPPGNSRKRIRITNNGQPRRQPRAAHIIDNNQTADVEDESHGHGDNATHHSSPPMSAEYLGTDNPWNSSSTFTLVEEVMWCGYHILCMLE